MRSPVADLLSDLGAGFSEIDAPWYLFGARAAILYGVARLTADVDVTSVASCWIDLGSTRRWQR